MGGRCEFERKEGGIQIPSDFQGAAEILKIWWIFSPGSGFGAWTEPDADPYTVVHGPGSMDNSIRVSVGFCPSPKTASGGENPPDLQNLSGPLEIRRYLDPTLFSFKFAAAAHRGGRRSRLRSPFAPFSTLKLLF